MASVA
jgi:hypothetical protein